MDGEFICIAECPEWTGISRMEVAKRAKELQREQVQEKKRELKKAAKKVDTSGIVDEIRRYYRDKSSKLVQLPGPSEEYTTPALEAAAEAAEAFDAKRPAAKRKNNTEFLEKRLAELKEENNEPEVDEDTVNYIRWKELEARIQAGENLNREDEAWHRSFGASAICSTMKMMEEDFGEKYWEVG